MTTKQIAKAVNKTERSVHNWVKKLSEKNAEVSEKIAEARKTSKPADYDLNETIEIIEIGLGKNAAMIYKQNAEQQEKKVVSEYDKDKMTKVISQTVLETLKALDVIPKHEQKQNIKMIEHEKNSVDEKKRMFNAYVNKIREIKNYPYQKAYNEVYYIIAKTCNIEAVSNCTHIIFLPGWEKSNGANVEFIAGKLFDCKMIYLTKSDLENNLSQILIDRIYEN